MGRTGEWGSVIGIDSLAWKFIAEMTGHKDVDTITKPQEVETGKNKFWMRMVDGSAVSVTITTDFYEGLAKEERNER